MEHIVVRFWGVRGSIPVPPTIEGRYGGNTPCVEVCGSNEELLVFDGGTGIFWLGQDLLKRSDSPRTIRIFLSHLHWDHIQGLPFFAPCRSQNFDVHIYGPSCTSSLSELLEEQIINSNNRDFEKAPYRASYHTVREGELIDLGWCKLNSVFLNHPAPDLGYRVECGERVLCYCTDFEPCSLPLLRPNVSISEVRSRTVPLSKAIPHRENRRLANFIAKADLCIQDATFDAKQYVNRIGWGHCSSEFAMEMAGVSGVKRLLIFHFAPENGDDRLDMIAKDCCDWIANNGIDMDVELAREGMEWLI